jgi:hypothetical protein
MCPSTSRMRPTVCRMCPLRRRMRPFDRRMHPSTRRMRPTVCRMHPLRKRMRPSASVCAPQPTVCAHSNPDHPMWQRCGSHRGQSKSRFILSKVNKTLTLIGWTRTLSDVTDGRTDETDGQTHRQPCSRMSAFSAVRWVDGEAVRWWLAAATGGRPRRPPLQPWGEVAIRFLRPRGPSGRGRPPCPTTALNIKKCVYKCLK